jgi:hypothetical protein
MMEDTGAEYRSRFRREKNDSVHLYHDEHIFGLGMYENIDPGLEA